MIVKALLPTAPPPNTATFSSDAPSTSAGGGSAFAPPNACREGALEGPLMEGGDGALTDGGDTGSLTSQRAASARNIAVSLASSLLDSISLAGTAARPVSFTNLDGNGTALCQHESQPVRHALVRVGMHTPVLAVMRSAAVLSGGIGASFVGACNPVAC